MAEIAAEVAAELPALREVTDLEDHAALFAGYEAATPLPHVRPEAPVQIQYTSGTTGFPKGAALHHRGLTHNARFGHRRDRAAPGATALTVIPMLHTPGCARATLG